MGASDLINAAAKYLARRGRPHMGNVGLKFSRSNPMKSQSKNSTKKNIPRGIPLGLYLISMTIVGTFSTEGSIASEINVPNSIPLLSRNSPPLDLSKFKCGDAYDIHQKLLIQNSIMINAIMRYKDVDSLSSQERNALEVIRKLVSTTDKGILDISNYNKYTKDDKDKDNYSCKVLKKVLEESEPILEGLKAKG